MKINEVYKNMIVEEKDSESIISISSDDYYYYYDDDGEYHSYSDEDVDYSKEGDVEFDRDGWDEDKAYMAQEIEKLVEPPYKLIAKKSNWRGSDGYATADSGKDVVEKSLSFDNDSIELRKDDDGIYISTGNHDVPMGFSIRIEHDVGEEENDDVYELDESVIKEDSDGDYFEITCPIGSEDDKMFIEIINQGIDGHLEAFVNSKFSVKDTSYGKRRVLKFHKSEISLLIRRLQEFGTEEAESWAYDIENYKNEELNESFINKEMEDFFDNLYDMYLDEDMDWDGFIKKEVVEIMKNSKNKNDFIQTLKRKGFLTKTNKEIEDDIRK
jgi:hypothetical protein